MAKPGSAAAALLSSGLIDLSKRPVSIDQQRMQLERKDGLRCGGCGRRIRQGFKFITYLLVEVKGAADRLVSAKTYACSNDDCYYAEKVMAEAAVMEMLPERVYLDEARGEKIVGAADPAMEFGPHPEFPPPQGRPS